MGQDLNVYLKNVNFDKQYKKLVKKLKNKKVIIYGTGELFQLINLKYDLSKFNIIGVSDRKYTEQDEGQEFLGYKIIPMHKINDYAPDYVLVSTIMYLSIIANLEKCVITSPKISVYPLVQKGLLTLLKEIWQ